MSRFQKIILAFFTVTFVVTTLVLSSDVPRHVTPEVIQLVGIVSVTTLTGSLAYAVKLGRNTVRKKAWLQMLIAWSCVGSLAGLYELAASDVYDQCVDKGGVELKGLGGRFTSFRCYNAQGEEIRSFRE